MFINLSLTYNYASSGGGAVYVGYGNGTSIQHSFIDHNGAGASVGGAILISNSTYVEIVSTTVSAIT